MAKDFDVTKNRIKFSLLWDKLKDPEFTTIRSWNMYKEDYYRSRIGQEFQVWKIKEVYPFTPFRSSISSSPILQIPDRLTVHPSQEPVWVWSMA